MLRVHRTDAVFVAPAWAGGADVDRDPLEGSLGGLDMAARAGEPAGAIG